MRLLRYVTQLWWLWIYFEVNENIGWRREVVIVHEWEFLSLRWWGVCKRRWENSVKHRSRFTSRPVYDMVTAQQIEKKTARWGRLREIWIESSHLHAPPAEDQSERVSDASPAEHPIISATIDRSRSDQLWTTSSFWVSGPYSNIYRNPSKTEYKTYYLRA